MKIAGSGSRSISQRHGSPDPDRYQNVKDPQHCFLYCFDFNGWFYLCAFQVGDPDENIFIVQTGQLNVLVR